MQNALYTGLFASLTTEHRMAMISNNLANVNTAGYKADALAFKDTMIHFAHDFIREPLENLRSEPLFPEQCLRARTRIATKETDFSQGSMQFTGNQLDIAIVGEGFYRVQAPQGEYLTRSSAFTKGPDGTLMTKQGYPVQGIGGNIVLPANSRNIHVTQDGAIFADGVEVGQLDVVTVEDPQQLKKVGNNLYGVPEGMALQNVLDGEGTMVSQGYTESANVNVVYEMVNMIEVQRMFEAQQKVMSTANEVDKQAISTVGKAR